MENTDFIAIFNKTLEENALPYGEYAEAFDRLCTLLMEANERMNLTAVRDVEGIATKHFADSLRVCSHIPQGAKMLDVGCGGGFPCLPVAIVRGDLCITALDSTEKKLTFVDSAVKALSLNVATLAGRAEELSHDSRLREKFDFVTARAVAALPMLCELCLPFVRVGGIFAAMKTDDSELDEAKSAIARLGAHVEKIDSTPLSSMPRAIILIKKDRPTPGDLPRAFAKIKKKAL